MKTFLLTLISLSILLTGCDSGQLSNCDSQLISLEKKVYDLEREIEAQRKAYKDSLDYMEVEIISLRQGYVILEGALNSSNLTVSNLRAELFSSESEKSECISSFNNLKTINDQLELALQAKDEQLTNINQSAQTCTEDLSGCQQAIEDTYTYYYIAPKSQVDSLYSFYQGEFEEVTNKIELLEAVGGWKPTAPEYEGYLTTYLSSKSSLNLIDRFFEIQPEVR